MALRKAGGELLLPDLELAFHHGPPARAIFIGTVDPRPPNGASESLQNGSCDEATGRCLLGLTESFRPRFVKRYATLSDEVRRAAREYAAEVRDGSFPAREHCFPE
jgi:3-methyl-2-oxobutanoate hydroxymethyltransferase